MKQNKYFIYILLIFFLSISNSLPVTLEYKSSQFNTFLTTNNQNDKKLLKNENIYNFSLDNTQNDIDILYNDPITNANLKKVSYQVWSYQDLYKDYIDNLNQSIIK